MLRACAYDFSSKWSNHLPLIEFAYNKNFHSNLGMTPYEVLYVRKCRSPLYLWWSGRKTIARPKLFKSLCKKSRSFCCSQFNCQYMYVGKEQFKVGQDHQKSCTDPKRRPLSLVVREKVCMQISMMKGVIRFNKTRNLNSRYVGLFEIQKKVGAQAYQLSLPPNLSRIHVVFHVSQLRRYVSDPSHVLETKPLSVGENLK